MSTQVSGAEPPAIVVTAKATLAAGTACLCLTVTQDSGNLWRYNLSEKNNSRLAYGKTSGPATWPPCAGPLRSARTATSPAASNEAYWSSSPPTPDLFDRGPTWAPPCPLGRPVTTG